MRPHLAVLSLLLLVTSGCYRYRFEQRPDVPEARHVTHEVRVPTYLNGFVGTGRVETARYCEQPVRTELEVTATDVLLSLVTLLIYTPHTLRVTCEQPAPVEAR
ncbi:Bor/Iss family lipoprotein [Pyxidicoccus sp. 3LFB2]